MLNKMPYKPILKWPTPDPNFKQIDIKITLDNPKQFFVTVKGDGRGIKSQVCDSQDEVREFVSSVL